MVLKFLSTIIILQETRLFSALTNKMSELTIILTKNTPPHIHLERFTRVVNKLKLLPKNELENPIISRYFVLIVTVRKVNL